MDNKGIEATIDRWEGDSVVLVTADNQQIVWPADQLPDGLSEGSVVWLTLKPDAVSTSNRKDLAKDILNEIFSAE